VVVVVVIHLRVLAAITPRQPEDLGVVVHTQTRQALLEHQAKDRQVVMVNLVGTIPEVVEAAQRLLVALPHQIPAMAVMAAQALTGSLLELIMRVEAGLVAVVLPEQVALAVVAMVDQMLLVLMELPILVAVAAGLETPLS
jgi:hypothetical protein